MASRRGERTIETLLFLCAFVSVGTTAGIIGVLALETFAFFREVSIVEFLTGTEWTPLFASPHFGAISDYSLFSPNTKEESQCKHVRVRSILSYGGRRMLE